MSERILLCRKHMIRRIKHPLNLIIRFHIVL